MVRNKRVRIFRVNLFKILNLDEFIVNILTKQDTKIGIILALIKLSSHYIKITYLQLPPEQQGTASGRGHVIDTLQPDYTAVVIFLRVCSESESEYLNQNILLVTHQ